MTLEPGIYYTVLRTKYEVSGETSTVSGTFFGTDDPGDISQVQYAMVFWALSEAIDAFGWEVGTNRPPDYGGSYTGLPWLWKDEPPRVLWSKIDTQLIARVCAVEEDGKKVRIATTESEVAVILLHIMRDVLYKMVESDPNSTAHDHATTWHFVEEIHRKKTKVNRIISVDKTRATDTFDLDLVESLYDGITDGQKSPAGRNILMALRPFATSRRRYLIPRYSEGVTAVAAKDVQSWLFGQKPKGFFPLQPNKNVAVLPMGSPHSYSLLTVWTSFELDAALSGSNLKDFLSNPVLERHTPKKIQGDDGILCGSNRVDKRLRRFCNMIGTTIGDGSHFCSRTYGVFCEEPAVRDDQGWEHLDLIKVRILSGHNVKKDPTRPAGKIDPLISRGKAVMSILRYASPELRDKARICVDKTTPALSTIRGRDRSETKFLAVPTYLGGLEYPSNRSDKRIWRKWVPRTVKRLASIMAAPNESTKPVVLRALLESTSWVSRHNVETRVDFLEHLLGDIPGTKMSKPFLSPDMFRKEEGSEVDRIGMVPWADLVEVATRHPKLGPMLQPDREGNPITSPEWRGKRRFRRTVERETPFIPLTQLISRLQRDDTLQGLLDGRNKAVPYFTYKDHCVIRQRNQQKAVKAATLERVKKTPLIKFKSFFDLKQRVEETSQTLWVNTRHHLVSDLLEMTGDLRVEP